MTETATPSREAEAARVPTALLGSVSAAATIIVVMPWFYPLGRLFDPSTGGDPRGPLTTELSLGVIGGVILSPLAAGIGALVGWRIEHRRLGPRLAAALVGVPITLGVALFVALNGGLIDESGSIGSLLFVASLGALTGAVAVSIFGVLRRFSQPAPTPRHER